MSVLPTGTQPAQDNKDKFLNGQRIPSSQAKRQRKHNGTLIICVQNFAVSGANAVLLNIIKGGFHPGNIIVLGPEKGELTPFFQEAGVAVRYGSLGRLLEVVTDIRLVICNTIMTAHYVLLLRDKRIPHCWILHEWWPKDVLQSQLSARKLSIVTPDIVARALENCHHIVYVCNGQKKMYGSPAPSSVIPVGVPSPEPHFYVQRSKMKSVKRPFTFLCLGIVCPRKNQVTAIKFFKEMAGDRKDVKMLVVGARYERDYEIEYCKKVEQAIGNDKRIELHPCTMDVEPFYAQSDVVIMTSTNEVTPLTISEAMMRGVPVITSDIAGIPDMLDDGVEGFVISLEDEAMWIKRMKELVTNKELVTTLGLAAAKRAKEKYSMRTMIDAYRKTTFLLSPPIILVDMDGVLVDWDKGFFKVWGDRPVKPRTNYEMELCVGAGYEQEAVAVYNEKDFFLNLPPMPGAIEAINAIAARGYNVKICTRPVLSQYCAQEKYEWVRKHLGPEWMSRIIMTSDKTLVSGALLIDDHPNAKGDRFPSWRQVVFDAPYNRDVKNLPRLTSWDQWEQLFEEELLFAPKASMIKKEEISKLYLGKKHFAIIRNLSWPMLGKNWQSPLPVTSPPTETSPPATESDGSASSNPSTSTTGSPSSTASNELEHELTQDQHSVDDFIDDETDESAEIINKSSTEITVS